MAIVDLDREAVKNGLADGSVLLIGRSSPLPDPDRRSPWSHPNIGTPPTHDHSRRVRPGHIPGSVSFPLSDFDLERLQALIAADGRRPVLSRSRPPGRSSPLPDPDRRSPWSHPNIGTPPTHDHSRRAESTLCGSAQDAPRRVDGCPCNPER
jgi:hypothetical protein